MVTRKFIKKILFVVFVMPAALCSSQPYQIQLSTTLPDCEKASASLQISGTEASDTLSILWSSGQSQLPALTNLNPGPYSVHINILHKLDTTLYFIIPERTCPITIANQFTPNNDGYNDVLAISHIANYPNFELEIYDRWGQKVHSQKSNYLPWDGKWAGINVPDGTYYYLFFFDAGNKSKLLKGDITILR